MGGAIIVGIRHKNGREDIAERWTNPLPLYLNDPAFFEDSVLVRSYLSKVKNDPDWVDGPKKIIDPSEYGVVLIDFQNKCVLSRNDYTGVGGFHVITSVLPGDKDRAKNVLALANRGWLEKIELLMGWGANWQPLKGNSRSPLLLSSSQVTKFLELVRGVVENQELDPEDHAMFQVTWKHPEISFDHVSCKGYTVWSEVREWVKRNGWKTPVKTVEQVRKELE